MLRLASETDHIHVFLITVAVTFFVAVASFVIVLTPSPVCAGSEIETKFRTLYINFPMMSGQNIKIPPDMAFGAFNDYGYFCSTLAEGMTLPDNHTLRLIDGLFAVVPCFTAYFSHHADEQLIQSMCDSPSIISMRNVGKVTPSQLCRAIIRLAKKTDYQQYRKFVVFLNTCLRNVDKPLTLGNAQFLYFDEKFVHRISVELDDQSVCRRKALESLIFGITYHANDPHFLFNQKKRLIEDAVLRKDFDLDKYSFPKDFLSLYFKFEEMYLESLLNQIKVMKVLR